MDDGLIFPYRRSTAHADARVLTHATARIWGHGAPSGVLVVSRVVVWGPSVQVGKRVNRGDAQW